MSIFRSKEKKKIYYFHPSRLLSDHQQFGENRTQEMNRCPVQTCKCNVNALQGFSVENKVYWIDESVDSICFDFQGKKREGK